MKKFFTKSRIIFLSVVIFLVSTILIVSAISPYKTYVILTNSMQPVINPGDLVIMDKRINIDEVKIGDIIGFKVDLDGNGEEEVVFHYVYKIELNDENQKEITTISEASDIPDLWRIHDHDLMGKYVRHIPRVGKVTYFFKSTFGIIFMTVNVIVVITLWELLFNKNKKDKSDKEEIKEVKELN